MDVEGAGMEAGEEGLGLFEGKALGADWVVFGGKELGVLFAEFLRIFGWLDFAGGFGCVEEPVDGKVEFVVRSGEVLFNLAGAWDAVEVGGGGGWSVMALGSCGLGKPAAWRWEILVLACWMALVAVSK